MTTRPHRPHPVHPAGSMHQANGDLLMRTAQNAGITDPKELSNFMGQMQVESQGFTKVHENLGYSGNRLETILTNPKTGKIRNGLTSEEVHAAVKGGEKTTAAALYGGEFGRVQLGNRPGTDDSYAYRGAGLVHLTGRANYERYGKELGLDLSNKPELAAHPDNAARIAVQFWKNEVVSRGAQQNVTRATEIINGGHNALQARKDAATHWQGELARGYKPGQPVTPLIASASRTAADPWKVAFDAVVNQDPNASLDDVAKRVAPLSITDADHPGNDLFKQARTGMQAIDLQYGRTSDHRTDQAAGLVAATAYRAGMTRIDHMELSGPGGEKIIAAQGTLGTAQSKVIDMATMQALNTPIAQSTQAFDAAQQSLQATRQLADQQIQQQPEPAMSR